MKHQSVNSLVIWLRVCVTAFALFILSLFLFSFKATSTIGDEAWKQLGLSKQQATESIYKSFTGGYLHHYQARNAKNVAIGDRLAIAKDLLDYSKQYIK